MEQGKGHSYFSVRSPSSGETIGWQEWHYFTIDSQGKKVRQNKNSREEGRKEEMVHTTSIIKNNNNKIILSGLSIKLN